MPALPTTAEEAVALQRALRHQVEVSPGPTNPRTVAGLDVAYADGSDRVAAAVVVLDAGNLLPVQQATATGLATFPYVPGLFAFRELPTLLEALAQLTVTPDVLVCDGQGLAHPERFGLACHVGLETGLPTIGVAKTLFIGEYEEPGDQRGDWSPLTDGGEVIGRVLRTRAGVKPVFVSVGHRFDLDSATELTLALTPRYRLPETTRAADQLSRLALRAG
ncbi:endonuclease V [Longispora fulva]|uniref:Endonuclease V n=1 Tax=Longispora fulva TaxID=619741 RepID=A0A8J7H0N2_9ACTN|nr:deoxyribonuclease V [Longispora fulva]MBG6141740.1 deoxyribonuclease V [Longispora fulva]GIG59104.1 endonuclease V [Longispora fulva]